MARRTPGSARDVLRSLKGKRIVVLKGGWSRERPISLKTGSAVEGALRRLGLRASGLDVRRDVFRHLARLKPDLAFIALHGTFGEDGAVQGGLDILRIPYTGSGPEASARAMDKVASKRIFQAARIPTPEWALVEKSDFRSAASAALRGAERLLSRGPVFVKPFDQGSAIGANRANSRAELRRAVQACLRVSSCALVERFIAGRELTVGVLGPRALPVIEIVPEHAFYDYHSKYAKGGSRHLVPAPIPGRAARRAQSLALAAHRALGCAAYSRVDLLLDKRGALWVLEANTIPGMTATSLLPDAARAAGISFDDLVLRIIGESRRARPA